MDIKQQVIEELKQLPSLRKEKELKKVVEKFGVLSEVLQCDGKTFSQKLSSWLQGNNGKCIVCGKKVRCSLSDFVKRGRSCRFCSYKCYGVWQKENITDEKRQQSRQNYYKMIETLKKKYGVTNPSQVKEFQQKKVEKLKAKNHFKYATEMKKKKLGYYGFENQLQLFKALQKKWENDYKRRLEKVKKFLNENVEVVSDLKNSIRNKFVVLRCKKCGLEWSRYVDGYKTFSRYKCPNCDWNKSQYEDKIKQLLQQHNIYFISNKYFTINNQKIEADVFIPDKKLVIEVNGLYWHCDKNKPLNYDRKKYEMFKSLGFDVLMFYQDEIENKWEVVKDIILRRIGLLTTKIYARQTTFQQVGSKEAKEFYEKNHIQSFATASKHYALVYSGEIVMMMSIGKNRRFIKNNKEWEIVRIATKKGVNVVGGLEKLLTNIFKQNPQIEELYSYVDNRLFSGRQLEKIGFEFVRESEVNWYWTDFKQRFYRFKFPGLSGYSVGLWRIGDYGSKLFKIKRKKTLKKEEN
jgi:very-short-patch-repair endonuclease/predicted RNA-binding Zn-ribbon protein involved in translation (DUF1610 family)